MTNNISTTIAVETTQQLPVPVNAFTGSEYRGGNLSKLQLQALEKGYIAQYWATLRQWNLLGRSIAAGQHSTIITFYKETLLDNGNKDKVLKRARVFNQNQLSQVIHFSVAK